MLEFDYSSENIERTIKRDYFNRNIYISNLIGYIAHSDEYMTYAVNGQWGSGKTVFMHQLMHIMKNQNLIDQFASKDIKSDDYEVFYYNAWENELMKKPSIAILRSIIDEYCIFSQEDKEAISDLLGVLSNIAIKIGTCGILGADDFKTRVSEDDISIDTIKETFRKTIDHIIKKKKCKRVVVIIDELDRCKPTNVIQLLEEIKHFYDHSSLTFIFSADLEQLGFTIKKLYGEHFDADLYLQRFFDASFTLNSASYEKYIIEELGFNIGSTDILNEICKIAISYCQLTVRETNKFVSKMKVVAKEISGVDHWEMETPVAQFVFIPWGIALKYKDNARYNSFMNGNLKKEEIRSFIEYSKELPSWLTEYYLRRREIPEDFDFVDTLYEIYLNAFKSKGFRYHREDYNIHSLRDRVAPYIEF